jgi:hypothetical protein
MAKDHMTTEGVSSDHSMSQDNNFESADNTGADDISQQINSDFGGIKDGMASEDSLAKGNAQQDLGPAIMKALEELGIKPPSEEQASSPPSGGGSSSEPQSGGAEGGDQAAFDEFIKKLAKFLGMSEEELKNIVSQGQAEGSGELTGTDATTETTN